MDLYGCLFTYAGKSSEDYNLVFANGETSEYLSLTGDISSNSVFNKRGLNSYFIGNTYDNSPIEFDVEIATIDGIPIPSSDLRDVESWLFYSNGYKKLYIDSPENVDYIKGVGNRKAYLNCRFVHPERMYYNGGVVGYKLTVQCDSPLAWEDPITVTFTKTSTDPVHPVITIPVRMDINEYIYPKVTITGDTSAPNIELLNTTDDPFRRTSFSGITSNTPVIVMDGLINYISDNYYEHFSNKNFVRFTNGDNKIMLFGNINEVSFTWQNRIFL